MWQEVHRPPDMPRKRQERRTPRRHQPSPPSPPRSPWSLSLAAARGTAQAGCGCHPPGGPHTRGAGGAQATPEGSGPERLVAKPGLREAGRCQLWAEKGTWALFPGRGKVNAARPGQEPILKPRTWRRDQGHPAVTVPQSLQPRGLRPADLQSRVAQA